MHRVSEQGRLFLMLVAVWVTSFSSEVGWAQVTKPTHCRLSVMDPANCIPARLTFTVLRKLPHSRQSFTQGLFWHEGYLYESTGRYGQCSVQKLDPATGKVLWKQTDKQLQKYFCEGLVLWKDQLIQLTWKAGKALKWSYPKGKNPGLLAQTFEYKGEGWGLTHDGEALIQSNGSANLVFRNPKTFAEIKKITVKMGNRPIRRLNELEYVSGLIYANLFTQNTIVLIHPGSGAVKGILQVDTKSLLGEAAKSLNYEEVLNGIAYNPKTNTFYLTGKNWPWIFEGTIGVVGSDQTKN